MSAKVTVTGNLGRDPEVRYTNAGTAVSELNIAATHSTKDKQTGQWSDVGVPLWLRATFWEDQAEHLANVLRKGDRVTVEGILVRKEFQKRDGTTGEGLELTSARFLGVVPRRSQNAAQAAPPSFQQGSY